MIAQHFFKINEKQQITRRSSTKSKKVESKGNHTGAYDSEMAENRRLRRKS